MEKQFKDSEQAKKQIAEVEEAKEVEKVEE
jgi:hypothetical protein